MLRSISWIVLFSLASAGCGGDADIVVRIRTLAGEDPFEGVGVLRLTLEQNEPGNVAFEESFAASETRIELPALSSNGIVRVFIRGYQDDTIELLLASGSTPWIRPKGGKTIQADVCFCKLDTIETGNCECPTGD